MANLKLPFVCAFLILTYADASATLIGQSAAYWAGDYSRVNELNPVFRPLLQVSPWVFMAGVIVSTCFVLIMLGFMNVRLASSVLFLGVLCHFVATSAWIIQAGYYGVILFLPLALVTKFLVDRDWRRFVSLSA